jgi:hypothetical protein
MQSNGLYEGSYEQKQFTINEREVVLANFEVLFLLLIFVKTYQK